MTKKKTAKGRSYTEMNEIDLEEISAVVSPAQTPAKATIMKRGTPADETESYLQDIKKRVQMTLPVDGHAHLVIGSTPFGEVDAGETDWNAGHSHPWVRDAQGRINLGEADGHFHTMDAMAITVAKSDELETPAEGTTADPIVKAEDSASTNTADDLGTDDMKKIEKAAEVTAPTQEEFDALAKRADRADKVVELSNSQRDIYSKMSTEEQDTFLALDATAREATVSKAADADPVVYTTSAGVELRKSADPLLVAMAKSNDDMAKKLTASEDLRKAADLEKRAGEQLSHLPGSTQARVALLKAVDTIEGTLGTEVVALLKSHDLGMSEAFVKQGSKGGPVEGGSPADKLDIMAKAHAEAKGMQFSKAYNEVISTDAGKALYAEHLNG